MTKRSWAILAIGVVSAAVAVSCQLQEGNGPAASTAPAPAIVPPVARGGAGGAARVPAVVAPATAAAAPVTPPASVATAPLAAGAKSNTLDKWVPIHNDFYWVDDKGARIQTRSGCLDKFGDTFYWYGGNNGFRQQMCYASTDLIHWVNKGVVLQHIVDANRIDVLYNQKTKKYVMFLKYDTNGAFLGIATADKPEGPFSFQKPPVTDAQMVAMSTQDLKDAGPFYLVDGARMGDMSAWMDDDGKAYIAYVSWAVGTNAQHGIYQMTDDFTGLEKRTYLWNIRSREAPHIFKRNDIYYYGTSRTAGIQSSGTAYYTAKELGGPWSPAKPLDMGASQNSWDSQVDFVYPFKGTQGELYMFAGDRWTKDVPAGRNGDYIWLPMEWKGDVPTVNYYQDWELNVGLGTWRKFDPARNLALGKKGTASSENGANVAANVTRATTYENYIDTVWESAANDPQWVQVDLGSAMDVNRVILKWGTEYAAAFKIQTSLDGSAWTDVYSTTIGGQGGYTVTDETFKTTTARFVRMLASSRGAPARGGRGGGGGRGGAAGGGGAGRGAAGGAPGAGRGGPTPAGAALSSGGYSLFAFEVLKD